MRDPKAYAKKVESYVDRFATAGEADGSDDEEDKMGGVGSYRAKPRLSGAAAAAAAAGTATAAGGSTNGSGATKRKAEDEGHQSGDGEGEDGEEEEDAMSDMGELSDGEDFMGEMDD